LADWASRIQKNKTDDACLKPEGTVETAGNAEVCILLQIRRF